MKRNRIFIISAMSVCLIAVGWFGYTKYMHTPHFVVVIPSYNNMRWYKQNLDSIVTQKYNNWHAVYIDDCSADGTGEAVAHYIKEHGLASKFTLIRNSTRCGALANLHKAIHAAKDDDIIITVDGDDWLSDPDVFTTLSEMYKNNKVWMTYGTYQEYPSGRISPTHAIPDQVTNAHAFRRYTWLSSHLRTFYAWLFKSIKQDDLQMNGQFFPKTWDMAFMFPMLEMAGSHAHWCQKVTYIYNLDNPINDWKENLQQVLYLERVIRNKKPYTRLA